MISITSRLQAMYNSNFKEKTPLELEKEAKELKQRIDKAIEKIKREYYINQHEWNDRIINEVLDILQGEE